MPSFCQVGQKAYLRINGDETPLIFDAPLDVSISEVITGNFPPVSYELLWNPPTSPYKRATTTTTFGRFVDIGTDYMSDSYGFKNGGFCSSLGYPTWGYRAPSENKTSKGDRYYWCFYQGEQPGAVKEEIFPESPGFWYTKATIITNRRVLTVYSKGDNKNTYLRNESYCLQYGYPRAWGYSLHPSGITGNGREGGLFCLYEDELIGTGKGWILTAKSNTSIYINQYTTTPTYKVTCGDPCPDGEIWDKTCNKCVCKNFPSLIASARQIKEYIAKEI